jgi:hypothetical protein
VALMMLCVALAVGFAFSGKRGALGLTLAFGGVMVTLYGAALLRFSAASQRVLLGHGQEKYFCEIDCHLAYSVVSAGYQPDPQIPGDTRYCGRTADEV